ncbi:MAG: hypothetical protein CSA81_10740 [Acidobacteria bacterium]|nr:MAG: hypothetical protein CSA81_10740 [Acidobacteriota bacterium]
MRTSTIRYIFRRKVLKKIYLFTLFSFLFSSLIFGQGNQKSTIAVTTYDSNGNVLPGVVVIVESPSLQGTRNLVTDNKGKALAALLPPGQYVVTVSMPGFQTQKWEGRASLGNITPLKFTMEANSLEEVVTVIAANPAIDAKDSTTKSNFGSDEVDKLPVSRNPIAIAKLTPGTTTRNPTGNLSIHGGNGSSNLMLVDGSEYSDNIYGSFRSDLVLQEAIEETQVLTSGISAEYGRFDGGVVNVVTKSGSNTFSGALRYEFKNPAWSASTPLVDDAKSKLNKNPEFTFGGPIIKDHLWFFVGYFSRDYNANLTYTDYITRDMEGNLLPIETRKQTYAYASETERYQIKLTYSPTSDHTISVNYVDNSTDQNLRAYVRPGSAESLVPQTNPSDVWKITYNGIITPNLAVTANFGKKSQNLTAGGDPNGPNPFLVYDYSGAFEGYDYTGRYNVFENGWFSAGDGGDNRDNTTGVLKFTYYLDSNYGFHNIDVGGDYYEGKRKAANHQSPTLQTIDAYGRRINADGVPEYFFVPGWNSIWVYSSERTGYATSEQYGLYINDRWEVNERLSVNLGIRYDKYEAADELGSTSVSSDSVVPRFSINYDLTGESKYYVNATYGKFTGKLLETVTNEVTAQGNPSEIDYAYIGDAGWYTAEEVMNFVDTHYDYSTDGIVYFRNPLIGTVMDPDLKPQQSEEYTLGFTWNANSTDYITATYINRDWNGFYDTIRTSDDYVVDDAGQVIYNRNFQINDALLREYEAIELAGAWTGKSGWYENISVGFNATFSDLKGNNEGEGRAVPVSTNGLIGDFEAEWQQEGYDVYTDLSPFGNLMGDVPFQINTWANYGFDFGKFGLLETSLLFQYADGETYSETGSFTTPEVIKGLTGSRTSTYFVNGERGTNHFNAYRSLDLGLRYNVPLWKSVSLFVEANVYNLTNYRGLHYWDTSWLQNEAGEWVKASTYGDPTSYYGGRSFDLAAGFRF